MAQGLCGSSTAERAMDRPPLPQVLCSSCICSRATARMFSLRYSEFVGEQGLTGHDYVHGDMRDMGDSKVKKTRSLSSKRLQPSGGGQDNDTNDSETEQTAYCRLLGYGSCSHLKGGRPRLGNQHKQILESFEFPAHYEGEQTTVPGTQSPAGIRERTSLQT